MWGISFRGAGLWRMARSLQRKGLLGRGRWRGGARAGRWGVVWGAAGGLHTNAHLGLGCHAWECGLGPEGSGEPWKILSTEERSSQICDFWQVVWGALWRIWDNQLGNLLGASLHRPGERQTRPELGQGQTVKKAGTGGALSKDAS